MELLWVLNDEGQKLLHGCSDSTERAMKPSWAGRKRDKGETAIVDALELAGWQVWRELPCDLLLWKPGVGFRTLENKRADAKRRKDQQKQDAFIALTQTPVVKTPEEALRAVGSVT